MKFNILPVIIALVLSLFAGCVGLSQRVIWTFMLGFVVAQAAVPYVLIFLPIRLYGFDVFFSCLVGFVCACVFGEKKRN